MKFNKKIIMTFLATNMSLITFSTPLILNSNNISSNSNDVQTYSSNEIVPENKLEENDDGPINYEKEQVIDETNVIPGTSINQQNRLDYLEGKYPLSGDQVENEQITLTSSDLDNKGIQINDLKFNTESRLNDMLIKQENDYLFLRMNLEKEIFIPFSKIVDENRMDILYENGSNFQFNFKNTFKSSTNRIAKSENNQFEHFATTDELSSAEFIDISNDNPISFDIRYDHDTSSNKALLFEKDYSFTLQLKSFINKDGFKFKLVSNNSNYLTFKILGTDNFNINEVINYTFLINSELNFFFDSLSYDLRKNSVEISDEYDDPTYIIDDITEKENIFNPETTSINSPFIISFEPSVNDNGIYNELLFIDDGSGGFEQVGIDPKTGLQTYNFFKVYKKLIQEKKLTGKVVFRVQVRKFKQDRLNSSYSQLSYYRIFEMGINSAQINFNLYGWNKDKYAEDLKKYTTPTIEELNKDKYSLKKKEEESTSNPYYRDFLDVNKGMYKPKIAWVKSRSKNGFLLDPYDENGNKINSNNNQNKYDVGYIAELNAPGIYSCDLNTSDNIGAVTQNIDIHYTNTEFNVKDEYTLDKEKVSLNEVTYEKFISELEVEVNSTNDLIEQKKKAFEYLKKYMKDSDLSSFEVIDPSEINPGFLVEEIDTSMSPIQITIKWSFNKYFVDGMEQDEAKTGRFVIKGFFNKKDISSYSTQTKSNNYISTKDSGKSLIELTTRTPITFKKTGSQISTILDNSLSNPVFDKTPVGSSNVSPIYIYDSTIKNELANSKNKIQKDHVYQLLKIDNTTKQKEWQEFINPNNGINKSIFDWFNYGLNLENDEKVFVDFWSTTQGYHLIEYLKLNGIIKSGSEISFMENTDLKTVINYWKMYVNSASVEDIDFPDKHNISSIELNDLYTSESDISKVKEYKQYLIEEITKELIKQINSKFNLQLTNDNIVYGIDFTIEDLDNKVHLLIQNYNNEEYNKGFELKIKSLASSSLLFGETTIKIVNNSSSKYMLDLNKIKSPVEVNFNTWNPTFMDVVFPEIQSLDLKIRKIIEQSVQTVLDRNSKKYSKNFLKLNVNYKMHFKYVNPLTLEIIETEEIETAIDFLKNDLGIKNNTVEVIVKSIPDENGITKSFGQASFKFNNSYENDVITKDPELDIQNPGANPDGSFPIEPSNPDGENGNNSNESESIQDFFKNNLNWIIPTIIGIILLVVFLIWIIKVRKKTTNFKM